MAEQGHEGRAGRARLTNGAATRRRRVAVGTALWATAGTLLDGEDVAVRAALEQELRRSLAPEGAIEELLMERIVGAVWRLRRLERVETSLCALGALGARLIHETGEVYLQVVGMEEPTASPVAEGVLEGQAWLWLAGEPRALSELARREAAVERMLYRALAELETRQRARRAEEDAAMRDMGG